MNLTTKQRQWAWFVTLWLSGLIAVSLLTYPLKYLLKHIAATPSLGYAHKTFVGLRAKNALTQPTIEHG